MTRLGRRVVHLRRVSLQKKSRVLAVHTIVREVYRTQGGVLGTFLWTWLAELHRSGGAAACFFETWIWAQVPLMCSSKFILQKGVKRTKSKYSLFLDRSLRFANGIFPVVTNEHGRCHHEKTKKSWLLCLRQGHSLLSRVSPFACRMRDATCLHMRTEAPSTREAARRLLWQEFAERSAKPRAQDFWPPPLRNLARERVQRNGLGVKSPASLPVQPGVSDPFGSNARGT